MEAKIIFKDAVNTVNRSGFLPSEILDQRNELLESLQNLLKLDYPDFIMTENSLHPANEAFKLINKITK